MGDTWYILSCIVISAAITWTMRATPFAMLKPLCNSELLTYLGERMPAGIMLILAAYTVRDVDPVAVSSVAPAVAGLTATVGLHLWRGSMTLSIFAGTAVYVAIASTLTAIG